MQRRELKKAIKKYAKRNRFYNYGLIAKLLKHQHKVEKELLASIPEICCPECNSTKIDIEHEEVEFSIGGSYLACDDCSHCFDDEIGYIDTVERFNNLCWNDGIAVRACFDDEVDFNSLYWKEFCIEEAKKMIAGGY